MGLFKLWYTLLFRNFMKLNCQQSLQIEILLDVVPWETEPVANMHTKVLVRGKNPRAARLKKKGKWSREGWKENTRWYVPQLARVSQENVAVSCRQVIGNHQAVEQFIKERKEKKYICQFLLISIFYPKRHWSHPHTTFVIFTWYLWPPTAEARFYAPCWNSSS